MASGNCAHKKNMGSFPYEVEFVVTLHRTDLAVIFAIALAGYAATYLILHRLIRRLSSVRQAEMERQLTALTGALHQLEGQVDALHNVAAPDPGTSELEDDRLDPAQETPIDPEREEITPGILAAITAASAAMLGRHVHIRSVRALPPHQVVSPWSQQGRVFVQGSHNLRSRR